MRVNLDAAEDELFFFLLGVVDHDLEHKTVYLGFRQRVSAFLLDGVLGSHHEEGIRQRVGLVADGHLMLLHGLEQGALYLGGRTVDLIGQDEVLILLRIDHRTDHVGRQQVGGKLNTTEVGVDGLCHRLDGEGLGQARHALEEDVSVGQQADQQSLGHLFLSDDDLVHLQVDQVHKLALTLDFLVQFTNVSFNHVYVALLILYFVTMLKMRWKVWRAARQKACKITALSGKITPI